MNNSAGLGQACTRLLHRLLNDFTRALRLLIGQASIGGLQLPDEAYQALSQRIMQFSGKTLPLLGQCSLLDLNGVGGKLCVFRGQFRMTEISPA